MHEYAKFVTFYAQPGKGAVLVDILKQSKQLAAGVDGHRLMVIGQDDNDADCVRVLDVWRTAEAHNQFQGTPAQIELVHRAIPILAAEPQRINFTIADRD